MSESILQKFLTLQHIKTKEESSIENLKKAIEEVKKILSKKRLKVIPYTLVALDPKVKDTDPVVQEVEGIIIKKWSTFKNNVTATKDKSTTYVRAVILESLSQLAKSDTAFAALVWHTARDVVQFYHLDAERDTISEFLQDVADASEKEGQLVWGINRQIQMQKFDRGEFSLPGLAEVEINGDILTERLKDAFIHSGWNSQGGGGKNPRPQTHGNWEWPVYASEKSAEGIAEVVNDALAQQGKSLSSISEAIKKGLKNYMTNLTPFFEEINNSFVSSLAANNKRSELIWWKQALYSPRLNTSYRGLSALDTAFLTAFDLADQVDPIYPVSVDYLLRETLKDLQGEEADKKKALGDWLDDISNATDDSKSALAEYAVENDERKTLLAGFANAASNGSDHFFDETGIDSKEEISLSDLAVWLFHGLQAHALATAK